MLHIASSRRCITPVGPYFPCYLCGHAMRTEKAIGIKDDLFVSVHRLLIDKTTLIFVSIELIGQTKASTDLLKDEISHQYAIDPDHINISFVHTHSAPEYAMESPFGHGPGAIDGYPEYIHDVIRKCKGHGGFAFGTGNSIPDYVPAENYLNMINIVRECRGDF